MHAPSTQLQDCPSAPQPASMAAQDGRSVHKAGVGGCVVAGSVVVGGGVSSTVSSKDCTACP